MSTDRSGAQIRERVWVTKVDHTLDPPEPVEEVFIENGRVVSVERLPKPDARAPR